MLNQDLFDRLFIDGDWVKSASEQRIEVISPVTEDPIAAVPAGSTADIDRAVDAARAALVGGWGTSSIQQRVEIIKRLRTSLVASREDLAQLITAEMGCPITQARNIQVVGPVGVIDSYLEAVERYPFSTMQRSTNGASALVLREPVGVVAAIVPWNVPLGIAVQKVVPAILAGCTVVLKPSPEAPLDAYALAAMLAEAGLPPGVLNVVPAERTESEYLVTHPGVDKVTFTGSSLAGRRIASLCGQDLRRFTLELGGKSAAVILEDADLDSTIEALRLGSFRNNGQICTLKTRVLAPAHLKQEVLERLSALVESMPVGEPSDPSTQIGPLVSARQLATVSTYIDIARNEGAKPVIGGGRPEAFSRGWYVEPTVFTDVHPDMRIAQEETFGPVISVLSYASVDEAIAIANNSTYGLNGSIFTTDIQRGVQIARRIHSGTVEINGNTAGLSAPMGGVKGSGIGRENGTDGLAAYTEAKAIGLPNHFSALSY